ncbi:hypothetical protein [Vogesella fluminis]|uniref:Transposase n=1 Tax=Vogesella fluminis TaxID=1069161 RepID=A0ABQ3HC82_9NEIS|nr:hypothetical protein [Vogesella fluminis]GHD76925.1 hypothetical protein GCM10011419_16950 [Vogesella fluminis]
MNYNGLRLKAEVDRVDFELLDGNGFRVAWDDKPKGKRVTDYQNHRQVFAQIIQPALTGEAKGVRPTYIEIALDLWGDRTAVLPFLAELVANSKLPLPEVRAFLPFRQQREHARRKGDTAKLSKHHELLETLQAGGTLYMGNQREWCGCKKSPVSVRAYWKETDGQDKGQAIDLRAEQHRGRFEVVIQCDGLTDVGLSGTDWQAWTAWSVTNAAKLFGQLIPEAPPAHPSLAEWKSARPGKRRDTETEAGKANARALRNYRRQVTGKDSGIRAFKGRPNTRLNRAILDALKVLDRRLKSGRLG